MPQLNKGGKYVFGLSAISNRREILFPAETLEQYPVQKEGRIIIFTGSKITGGFCVTSKQLLGQSKLKHILDDCTRLMKENSFAIKDEAILGCIFLKTVL